MDRKILNFHKPIIPIKPVNFSMIVRRMVTRLTFRLIVSLSYAWVLAPLGYAHSAAHPKGSSLTHPVTQILKFRDADGQIRFGLVMRGPGVLEADRHCRVTNSGGEGLLSHLRQLHPSQVCFLVTPYWDYNLGPVAGLEEALSSQVQVIRASEILQQHMCLNGWGTCIHDEVLFRNAHVGHIVSLSPPLLQVTGFLGISKLIPFRSEDISPQVKELCGHRSFSDVGAGNPRKRGRIFKNGYAEVCSTSLDKSCLAWNIEVLVAASDPCMAKGKEAK